MLACGFHFRKMAAFSNEEIHNLDAAAVGFSNENGPFNRQQSIRGYGPLLEGSSHLHQLPIVFANFHYRTVVQSAREGVSR